MSMTHNNDFSLAVIADIHFHDIEGDYGVPGIDVGARSLTLRTWADTRTSTRVFNESALAFEAALDAVVVRGIRHVVLLGDYTDDGQRQTTASIATRLAGYEERYGLRFYALPGNHDIFGPSGRHQAKRFLQADGSNILVTSDRAETAPGRVVNSDMYCEGYPLGLLPMAAFGYFRRPEYLHWETPFESSDSAVDRLYTVSSLGGENTYSLMDASYLVEPEAGLWLLMLDANVFEPRDGDFPAGSEQAFIDSTAAGWNAMLRLKPFILDWIADVAKRARHLGKTLLAFSHYPAIDPFDDPTGAEQALFPQSNMTKRKPASAVAEALIAAGITVHFSGHLHVEGVTRHRSDRGDLVNVAVPSLVAFPPAFKHLKIDHNAVVVDTIDLSALPLDREVMALYERECICSGEPVDPAIPAETYGQFLRLHTSALVQHRYFPKEWPQPVVDCLALMSLEQLCLDERTRPDMLDAAKLAAACQQAEFTQQDLTQIAMSEIVSDWYCLRQAGGLALPVLGERRMKLLQWLADVYEKAPVIEEQTQIKLFLRVFFQAMRHFLSRASDVHDRIFLTPQDL